MNFFSFYHSYLEIIEFQQNSWAAEAAITLWGFCFYRDLYLKQRSEKEMQCVELREIADSGDLSWRGLLRALRITNYSGTKDGKITFVSRSQLSKASSVNMFSILLLVLRISKKKDNKRYFGKKCTFWNDISFLRRQLHW